jgi:hypothetical protein
MNAPAPIELARDAAFLRYGRLRRFEQGDTSLVAAVHPAFPAVGTVGDLVAQRPDGLLALLPEAERWLVEQGALEVQGPISRHTWYPFRAVTDGWDALPRLSGEPWNPPWLPGALVTAGYAPLVESVTTLSESLEVMSAGLAPKRRRAEAAGYRFRPMAGPADLAAILSVVNRSFKPPENHLFAPIDLGEFLLVLGVPPVTVPPAALLGSFAGVRLAESPTGEVCGFVYVTLEGQGLGSLKTLAVVPEHAGSGLGGALAGVAHDVGLSLGLTAMAHTLMVVDGAATSLSSVGGCPVVRRYAVYGKSL